MAIRRRKRPARRVIISFRGPTQLRDEIRGLAERAHRTQSDYLRLLVADAIARERVQAAS